MAVWRLMAHHDPANQENAINRFRATSKVAIGWGAVGDLQRFHTPEEIRDRIREEYGAALQNAHLGGPSLWRFCYTMQVGDLVIVNDSDRPRRMVMRITGDYQFVTATAIEDYHHQRPAEYVEQDPDALYAGPASGENIRWTVFRCR